MTTPALELRGVTRRYGDVVAVDRLDLRVERGEVYGFLGLNGAGKTTTIRMLLGMIRPSEGSVAVLGEPIGPGRGPWGQVGHLVEVATAYPELTVRENLAVAARLQGLAQHGAAVRDAVERLGLTAYTDRPAATLSLGNLQRLALARALLHEPALVILDEPANGLDPAGVVQIRGLIASLSRERGVTVFMSSHILGEVARVATRVGILHRGRLIDELDAATLEGRRARWLMVDARDRVSLRAVLEAAGHVAEERPAGLRLDGAAAVAAPDEIVRLLVSAGVIPTRVSVDQEDLEAYFLRLTGETA